MVAIWVVLSEPHSQEPVFQNARGCPSASPGSVPSLGPRGAKAGPVFPPAGGYGNLHFHSQPVGGALLHAHLLPGAVWDLPTDATLSFLMASGTRVKPKNQRGLELESQEGHPGVSASF